MRCAMLSAFSLFFLAGCASSGGDGGLVTTGRTPTTTQVATNTGSYEINSIAESRTSVNWIRAPEESVWRALPAVYRELGIEDVGIISEAAHQFGNRGLMAHGRLAGERISEFLDCGESVGGARIADTWTIEYGLISTVTSPGDAGTELRTTLDAQASPRAVSGAPTRCRSTGTLEARITEMVKARVGESEEP